MTNKTYIHCFVNKLNAHQHFVYKKAEYSLHNEWINLPQNKEKTYFKLYIKLLKSQILQSWAEKKKKNQKWTFEEYTKPSDLHARLYRNHNSKNLHFYNPFNEKVKASKFNGHRFGGITSYREKVYDLKGAKNKIKIYKNYKKSLDFYKA